MASTRRTESPASVSALHAEWPHDSFAGRLDFADLSAVMKFGRSVCYRPGEQLMCEGDEGDFAVVVRRGQAKVVVSDGAGRDCLLDVAGPGDLLGEMACLDGRGRSASVVALREVHGTLIAASAFRNTVTSRPSIACAVARLASDRLRVAHRVRVEIGVHGVTTRLVRVLRELRRVFDTVRRDPGYTIPLSQTELAQLINASEVSVQRAMRELRRRRLVTTGYRTVLVPCASCLDACSAAASSAEPPTAKAITGCGGVIHHPRG